MASCSSVIVGVTARQRCAARRRRRCCDVDLDAVRPLCGGDARQQGLALRHKLQHLLVLARQLRV
jgi:hypothetical protein